MNNTEISKLYNIDDIMDLIYQQMLEIMRSDYNYYKNYNIKIANEQYYVSPEDRKEPNIIYIVVKFLPADVMFNQNIVPITITAVSEYNNLEACQRLLLEYAQTYNLQNDVWNGRINYDQTYTTPQVMSNFSEVYYGYRNTLFMSGTFLLSYNSNPSKLYYVDDEEGEILIDTINFTESFGIQIDSQPFFGTNNRTRSVGKFGTHTISFTMFLVDDVLCNKILDIVLIDFNDKDINVNEDVNKTYKFKISYHYGQECIKNFKLVSFDKTNNAGEMPIISVTFTC
jgi:hypothetical protein